MVKGTQGTQSRVWTPISNAFEAYRRRLITDPTAFYEHTWRLIHIQESLVVTLGTALATRLFHLWKEQACTDTEEWSSLQNIVTGKDNFNNYDSNSNSRSCLSGSIVAWINLLQRFSRAEIQPQCPFVNSLKEYLFHIPKEKPNSVLLEVWQSIGVVPTTASDTNLTRIKQFEAINTLRNKLAHVPISGRILPKLHIGLRQEVISLLTNNQNLLKQADNPTADLKIESWHQPLCGHLIKEYAFITGSDFGKVQDNQESNNKQVFWKWCNKDNPEPIKWQASPFVHIDDELKVSLLFRLHELSDDLDEDLDGDYHRFAAEVEPVQKQKVLKESIKLWIQIVPVPAVDPLNIKDDTTAIGEPSVTQQDLQAEQEDVTAYELRSKAEDAFRERNYERAMSYFDKLANKNDPAEYNDVAKSKHGAAMWRTANRFLRNNKDKQIQLMRSAINLLKKASQHQDIGYKARALYERSKALWHISQMIDDNTSVQYLLEAKEDANTAATLVYDLNYLNWLERLRDIYDSAAASMVIIKNLIIRLEPTGNAIVIEHPVSYPHKISLDKELVNYLKSHNLLQETKEFESDSEYLINVYLSLQPNKKWSFETESETESETVIEHCLLGTYNYDESNNSITLFYERENKGQT